MIASGGAGGTWIAHLGGPYGDRLSLSRDGGAFARLADLGFDADTQSSRQRRLAVTPDAVLVLEPLSGPFLVPPFRVRRFGPDGAEGEPREDEAEGPGDLIVHSYPGGRFVHGGIDVESGRPLRWERRLETDRGRNWGSVLHHEGAWWYQLRGAAIVKEAGGAVAEWPCDPGPIQLLGGRVVCVTREAVFVDGDFTDRAGPYFTPWNGPLTAAAAAAPDGRLVVLKDTTGPVPGRVPPGLYSALVTLGETVLAVEESNGPRLVPVGL